VESVYPKKRDVPKNFLDGVVGDMKRQVENERVEEVVSSGSIDHDLRAALEVRASWRIISGAFPISSPAISESMGLSTRPPRYHFMIAPLTLSSCRIGKTRLSTSQRMTRDWLSLHGLTSWLLLTSLSNPARGHKASFGVREHHFATSLRLSSTTLMTSFQRSALPVRRCSSYSCRA
jgi:hypothetical protein